MLVGDSIAQVLEKCGPPSSAVQQCDGSGHHCNGRWTYRLNDGSFPRYVRFVDDTVRGIEAGSRFAAPSLAACLPVDVIHIVRCGHAKRNCTAVARPARIRTALRESVPASRPPPQFARMKIFCLGDAQEKRASCDLALNARTGLKQARWPLRDSNPHIRGMEDFKSEKLDSPGDLSLQIPRKIDKSKSLETGIPQASPTIVEPGGRPKRPKRSSSKTANAKTTKVKK